MGEPAGVTQSKKYTKQAVGTLRDAQAALLLDPNFLLSRDLGYELASDPFSWNAAAIENAKNSVREGAYGSARSQMAQNDERATAAQGFRSGTTRAQERQISQGLGSELAQGFRAIDTQAALQRPNDLVNAINAQLPILQTQFQFPRDIAAVLAGQASNPILAQPSPLQGIGQGVGGLLGVGLAPGGFFGGGKS